MADLAYGRVYAMNKIEARKLLIQTWQETKSIRATARLWHTSPQTVRKWVRRFLAEGVEGLRDRSRRPHHSPRRTPPEIEARIVEARKKSGYGPKRLAILLAAQGCFVSRHTIRHVLRRHGLVRPYRRRHTLYPAFWAYDVEEPFTLIQTDVKDIHDKQALGTQRCHHLTTHHLPRFQWTACEARTRLRFLAYSHHLNQDNGLSFMILVLLWLRAHGISGPVSFQTDWGQEFGGTNPDKILRLQERFLAPLDGSLCRIPLGRKQYNGRVERSHRTDDDEFYRPYLLTIPDQARFLDMAALWQFFYNALRPHQGYDMDDRPPLGKLKDLGYNGSDSIATFPIVLLDDVSADLLLGCDPEVGNNLLAQYNTIQKKIRFHLLLVISQAPHRALQLVGGRSLRPLAVGP